MRVLSIGTDRKLFEEGSAVRARQEQYAKELGTMDVIVFTLKKHHAVAWKSGPLSVTPTDSYSSLFYGINTAFAVGNNHTYLCAGWGRVFPCRIFTVGRIR